MRMSDSRAKFRSLVARLRRRARLDLLLRRSTAGLFFGLLPGLAAALLAGTIALPVPALPLAAAAAAAGLAAGAFSALAGRVDRRRLLIQADAVLGTREVISTALELERQPGGAFTAAIVEDAAALLDRTAPRVILGRPRLALAPFAAIAAVLTAAALLYPVDLRALFPRRSDQERELAQIGEDLRKEGEKLAEDARARDLGRSLELSQDLAQLGRDLADRKITPEDALDRMSDLESGLSREYQMRTQQVQPDASGMRGPGTEGNGEPGAPSPGPGDKGIPGSAEAGRDSAQAEDPALKDMGDALNRLRRAQRDLRGQGGGSDQAQAPGRPQRPANPPGGPGQGLPGGAGQSDQQGRDQGRSPLGKGSGGEEQPGQPGGSGIGTQPSPEKRGTASAIIGGNRGPGLQAQGNAGEGDSTRLLARALPQWTGSRLPEETILNQYSQQAESALARDEIPLKLRQSVKEYFTSIGITK
jgi:hypothetical protein